MLRTDGSHWKISRIAGIVVFLVSIPYSKRTDTRKLVMVIPIRDVNFSPLFSLAYDRGWRVRTDWKQYQLLKQYVLTSFSLLLGPHKYQQSLLVDVATARW